MILHLGIVVGKETGPELRCVLKLSGRHRENEPLAVTRTEIVLKYAVVAAISAELSRDEEDPRRGQADRFGKQGLADCSARRRDLGKIRQVRVV